MTGILELPEELILLVVQHLAFKNLTNLALVCKRMVEVARHSMMDRPMIYIGPGQDQQPPRHIYLFKPFLQRYPNLIDAIKWLDLGWDFKRLNPIYQEVLELAASSISMKRVSINLLDRDQLRKLKILYNPPPGRFRSLEEVDIALSEDEYLNALDVAKLCELPGLKVISCEVSNISSATGMDRIEYEARTSNSPAYTLQALTATPDMVDLDLLELILPRAKNLLELYISLPGILDSESREYRDVGSPPFSPAAIATLLQPVAHSLQRLSISTMFRWRHNNKFVEIVSQQHDNSVLDLSGFRTLSYLRLSSWLLFGGAYSAVDSTIKDRVLDILPPNIEHLTINFEGLQGIYARLENVDDGTLLNYWTVEKWETQISPAFFLSAPLNWLQDICARKSEGGFPNLKSITLEECWANEWGQWELFDVAQLHPKLVETGIELQILVMVPAEFAVECGQILRRQGFKGGIDSSHETKLENALAKVPCRSREMRPEAAERAEMVYAMYSRANAL